MQHSQMGRPPRVALSHYPSSRSIGFIVSMALSAATTLLMMGCDDVVFPDPNVIYLAFGDSATDGPSEVDYPDTLPGELGVEAVEIGKQGRGGETTAEGIERLRMFLERDLFPNAEVLLYWEGGGDLIDTLEQLDPFLLFSPVAEDYPFTDVLNSRLDQTQANMETLILDARNAGLTVYVMTYFLVPEETLPCDPLFLDVIVPSQVSNANDYFRLLNGRIRSAADSAGAILIDVETDASELTDSTDNFFDCNHLSASGNAIVAELIASQLQAP